MQVEKIEESIKFIRSRPKPLALYIFTKNQTLQRRMISETSSGSVTFNDAILQVLPHLPSLLLIFLHILIFLIFLFWHNICLCSMRLIVFHLEEWEKVGLECTMGNFHLTHLATKRQLWEEVSSLIFGTDILHGH